MTIDRMSDIQIIHQLLSQLGIKLVYHQSRTVEGHEGKRIRVWELDVAHWDRVWAVLERREAKRQQFQQQQADSQTGAFAAGTLHRYISKIPTAVSEPPVALKTALASPVEALQGGMVGERQAYKVGDCVAYIGTDPVLQSLTAGAKMSIARISRDRVEYLMPDCFISPEMSLSDLQLSD